MQAVVLTIHLLLAVALILVVLLQRSEGGGLGMGSGGIMTSRGAATALSKATWALGAAFVVTSLALTVLAAREAGVGSVIDRVTPSAPLTTPSAPTAPGLEGDLLPPAAETPAPAPESPAPATPAPATGGPAAPPPVQ